MLNDYNTLDNLRKRKKRTEKKPIIFPWYLKFAVILFVCAILGMGSYFYIEGSKIDPSDLQYKFVKEYSDLAVAYSKMQKKGFNFQASNKTHSFAKNFAGFFELESLCEDYSDACLWNNFSYKTLDGKIIAVYLGSPNIGQFRVRSGALYMLYEHPDGMWVLVDTNGITKGPNRFGLDLFSFYIRDNNSGLKLMGERGTPYNNMALYCDPYESNKYNGLSCPYKAFLDKEYFYSTVDTLY